MPKLNKRAQELQKIAEEIAKCKICQKGKVGLAVPGEGSENASIIFLGEAPGKQEAETGQPFMGRSGKFLRSLIKEIGIKESKVFITSPVKYLPKYVTPTLKDIEHGTIHLQQQINIIKPKVIVLLGSTAVMALLKHKVSVSKEHGKVAEQDGMQLFISYHPAAALYLPTLRPVVKKDFLKLKKLIKEKA